MFDHLSNVELRLELAEAMYDKRRNRHKSQRGNLLAQDHINAITRELIDRGAF